MDYVFKSSLNVDEIFARKNVGGKYLEIQLFSDFIEKSNLELFNSCINTYKDFDILSIHVPLCLKDSMLLNGCIYLENITNDFNKKCLIKTCELAEMYAKYYKHNINIILHNSFSMLQYINIPSLLNEIVIIFNELIEKFPDVVFHIENSVSITKNILEPFTGKNGGCFESTEIVNYLNYKCIDKKFRTVLDICHALTNIKYADVMGTKLALNDYFVKNFDIIGTIHLANLKNFGTKPGEHGCDFNKNNKNDMALLNEIFYNIEIYCNEKTLICLEVSEKDGDYINLRMLKNTLESCRIIEKEHELLNKRNIIV